MCLDQLARRYQLSRPISSSDQEPHARARDDEHPPNANTILSLLLIKSTVAPFHPISLAMMPPP